MDPAQILARIEARLKELKLSERKACLNAGISLDAIRNIRRGYAPKYDTIIALSTELGLSPAELGSTGRSANIVPHKSDIFGDLENRAFLDFVKGKGAEGAEHKGRIKREGMTVPSLLGFEGEEYAAVGVYDATASAGPGALNVDYPEPQSYHLFPLNWLRSIRAGDPTTLAILAVAGDSMQPTLENGDQILIDRSVRHLGRDGLYVLAADHETQVKRLSRDPRDRSITIRSDNPKAESWEGVDEDMVHVLGRVLWLGRKLEG